MADSLRVLDRNNSVSTEDSSTKQAQTWSDYGIALLGKSEYAAAQSAFERAAALDPGNLEYPVNAAIAIFRTERSKARSSQMDEVRGLLKDVLLKNPEHARGTFFDALALREVGDFPGAIAELLSLVDRYPRDRELRRQLGQLYFTLGDYPRSVQEFQALLAVDPNDAGAYQFLAPLYVRLGRRIDADRATDAYDRLAHYADTPRRGCCPPAQLQSDN